MPAQALEIRVKGIVQGVGFRPFVYQLARRFDLCGRVFNTSGDVTIHLEGEDSNILCFLKQLRENPPPRSRIETIVTHEAKCESLVRFYYRAKCDSERRISTGVARSCHLPGMSGRRYLIRPTGVTVIPLPIARTAARASPLSKIFPTTAV